MSLPITDINSTPLSMAEVVATQLTQAKIIGIQQAQIERLKTKYRDLKSSFQSQLHTLSRRDRSVSSNPESEAPHERDRDRDDEIRELELSLAACREIITHQEHKITHQDFKLKHMEERAERAEHFIGYWAKEVAKLKGEVVEDVESLPSSSPEESENDSDNEATDNDIFSPSRGQVRLCAFHREQRVRMNMTDEGDESGDEHEHDHTHAHTHTADSQET